MADGSLVFPLFFVYMKKVRGSTIIRFHRGPAAGGLVSHATVTVDIAFKSCRENMGRHIYIYIIHIRSI